MDNPQAFLDRIKSMKDAGYSEPDIAKALDMTITEMRAARHQARRTISLEGATLPKGKTDALVDAGKKLYVTMAVIVVTVKFTEIVLHRKILTP